MILVFDLDDTLYDELTFVFGGFHAVADFLAPQVNMTSHAIFSRLRELVLLDREKVFDRFFAEIGMGKALVKDCVRIYRAHPPKLRLFSAATACLRRLQHHTLYLLTDGNKVVQKRKVDALEIEPLFRRCVYTNVYGARYNKPSPYCFFKICEWENTDPSHIIHIADNPRKDFVDIKKEGFKTIRVLTGQYRHLYLGHRYEAELVIQSLNELTERLLQRVIK